MKLREVVDLQTRMDDLERLVKTLQPPEARSAWG